MPVDRTPVGDDGSVSELDRLLEVIWALVGDDGDPVAAIETERFFGTIAPVQERTALSPRELEILRLVAQGLPNKAIAQTLDISPHTVASHLRRMFVKVDVRSRAALVATALGSER